MPFEPASPSVELDSFYMRRALELAARGEGRVEPNPQVGSVIVRDGEIVGEGFHRQFGGPHAEVEALRVAGPRAQGATLYVTLEPCCHHGKTPPCTQAILAAGVARVVAAVADSFPAVAGRGLAELAAAGVATEVGLLADEARQLLAPYLKLVSTGRPWIIAKWAMTLDGKLATHTGDSRWISSEASRAVVHALRGRVDAILVGRGTAQADDPLLTARPPGPRTPLRVVVDTKAVLASDSQLVRTAREFPLLVAVGQHAPAADRDRLTRLGCEVFVSPSDTHAERLEALLVELGRRRLTNVLVEGGGSLLGSLFDRGEIDEVQVFIAPKLVGGQAAPSPLGGTGLGPMAEALRLASYELERLGDDLYLHGRINRPVVSEEI